MKIKTYTGLTGWQGKLRNNYANFQEWESYAEMFGLHLRLGHKTTQAAWDENPTIQVSVQPTDFCKVVDGVRHFYNLCGDRINNPMDYDSLFSELTLLRQ